MGITLDTADGAAQQPVNHPESNLHVLDPNGDMILKIIDGLEHYLFDEEQFDWYGQDYEQESERKLEELVEDRDAELVNSGVDTARLEELVQNPTPAKSDGQETIFVKISKRRLCAVSSFFRSMLTGGFAEAQQEFSQDNPPIIKLEEADCVDALLILTAIYDPESPTPELNLTFHGLLNLVHLAERWDCVRVVRMASWRHNIVGRVLELLPQKTPEQRTNIISTQIRHLFDAAEVLGDTESCKPLSWFMQRYLKVHACCIVPSQFMTNTDRTLKIMTVLQRRVGYLEAAMSSSAAALLAANICETWDPLLTKTHIIGCILENIGERAYSFQHSALMEPILQLLDIDHCPPQYDGNLQDLWNSVEVLRQARVTDTYQTLCEGLLGLGCRPCSYHIWEWLDNIVADLNRTVRPLCIMCLNNDNTRLWNLRFLCEDHECGNQKWWLRSCKKTLATSDRSSKLV